MSSNTDKCIEYALHAYDTFWDYYKKTLDERNTILNNYLLFVGIPVSIVGAIIEKIKNDISQYRIGIILALVFILILGLTIYHTYIVESFVSERYLKRIKQITEYLSVYYDKVYDDVFKKAYILDNLFLDKKSSLSQRIGKGIIIIMINTWIIIGIFYFTDCFRWYYSIFLFVLSYLTHIMIFIYKERTVQSKK